jgi:exopolysaccharide production protein ExoQ
MIRLLKNLELGFVIVSILIFSGAIILLILSGGQQQYEEVESNNSSLIRIVWFAIYFITCSLLVFRWQKTLDTLRQDYWVFALITFAGISIIWSSDQATTAKDTVTIFGSSLFGLYFASRYSLKEQLQILGWVFGTTVVLSFIFAVAVPKYGIMGGLHQGKWRGVFTHKNGLGQSMVYGALIFLFLSYQTKKHRLLMWVGLSLSILLLLLSGSTSSIANLAILICIFFILYFVRLPYLMMIPAIIGVAAIGQALYFLSINNAELLFNSVGKDTTLTGRSDLWPAVIEMIGKQPWFGYGYGGFWRGLDGAESAYIWRATAWTPSHPHNGFLQLLLDLGIVGLALFFVGFLNNLIKGLNFIRSTQTVAALWPVVHMAQLIVSSLAETQLFNPNNIGWILYVSAAFSLGKSSQQES